MSQTPQSALDDSELYSDDTDYRLVQLPANGITLAAGIVAEAALPFSALLADKDEVTLLLPQKICEEFSGRLGRATISEQRYRLITFDAPLEPALVGFMAIISACLSDADIPILSFAAYSRDHIFVPTCHFERAIQALENLQGQSS